MSSANFVRCDFRGANIMGADLSKANFGRADFRKGYIMNYETGDTNTKWGQDGTTEFSGSLIRETNMSGVMAQHSNFSDANLQGVIMQEANLTNANLSGSNLAQTDLTGSNLSKAQLDSAFVENTILDGVMGDLSTLHNAKEQLENRQSIDRKSMSISKLVAAHSKWVETAGNEGQQLNLDGYNLNHEQDLRNHPLTMITAKDCNFIGLNLDGASMQSSKLDNSDFQDCAARMADFRGSSFKKAIFKRADLTDCNFGPLIVSHGQKEIAQTVDLTGAHLGFAKLENACFHKANLKDANLSHANLQNADLSECNLDGTILDGANMKGTKLNGTILEKQNTETKNASTQ